MACYGAKQVGALEHAGGGEKAAIAAASDGELFRAGIFVFTEPLRGGNEVVKDVLFFVKHSCFVPVFTVLSAASQICDGIYAAELKPGQGGNGKIGFNTNIKPAIAIKESRIAAIELEIFPVCDEHRDTGAIFGMIEYLFCFISRGVEVDLWFTEDRGLVGGEIITKNSRGKEERRNGEEHFAVILLSG